MSKIDFGKKVNLSTRVENDILRSEKKGDKRNNFQDRADRATQEQVLDPRTRLILFKMLNSGYISEIDGCLSTGKEANAEDGATMRRLLRHWDLRTATAADLATGPVLAII